MDRNLIFGKKKKFYYIFQFNSYFSQTICVQILNRWYSNIEQMVQDDAARTMPFSKKNLNDPSICI